MLTEADVFHSILRRRGNDSIRRPVGGACLKTGGFNEQSCCKIEEIAVFNQRTGIVGPKRQDKISLLLL